MPILKNKRASMMKPLLSNGRALFEAVLLGREGPRALTGGRGVASDSATRTSQCTLEEEGFTICHEDSTLWVDTVHCITTRKVSDVTQVSI